MTEYKGRNADGMSLSLTCTDAILVEFYDADGNLVKVKEAQWMGEEKTEVCFSIYEPIDGISFVKLVGEGNVFSLDVMGIDIEYHA